MSSSDHVQNKQFLRGTLGQVGSKPGLARKVFGTPSARQAAANKGISQSGSKPDDTMTVMDHALAGMPIGRALGMTRTGEPQGGPFESRFSKWSRGG
mgnify:CR=1 FL=1